MHGGTYTPPPLKLVEAKILGAIGDHAHFDGDSIDSTTIAKAARNLFGDDFRMSDEDISWLERRVRYITHQEVRIESVSPDNFRFRVKGKAAYLKVTRGKISKLLIFGPYRTPLSWD
jgi:hypothetical protein